MKKYLYHLLAFSVRHNPGLWAVPLLCIVSTLTEMLALLCLVPLTQLVAHAPVHNPLTHRLADLGLHLGPEHYIQLFLGLMLVRMLCYAAYQGLSFYYGKKIHWQLSVANFSHILRTLPVRDIQKQSIGHYSVLVWDEAFRAGALVLLGLQLSQGLMLAVGYYLGLLWAAWPVALGVLGFFVVSALCVWPLFAKARAFGRLQVSAAASSSSACLDGLSHLRVVRLMGAQRYVSDLYASRMRTYTDVLFKVDYFGVLIKLSPLIVALGLALLYTTGSSFWAQWVGVYIGETVVVLLFLARFLPAFAQVVNFVTKMYADAKAAQDVTAGLEVAIESPRTLETALIVHQLQLNALGYTYDRAPVFKGLAYTFEKGKSYAIVGPSGAGKTTLLHILSGLLEDYTGSVRLDNQDLKEISLSQWREVCVVVDQDTAIFHDTIRNNILLGAKVHPDVLTQALYVSGVSEFLASLPQGLDTELAFAGSQLSGGQKQRVGIARALVRNPQILILDESTAALDEETKNQVVARLRAYCQDKILIFVTHDLQLQHVVDASWSLNGASVSEVPC